MPQDTLPYTIIEGDTVFILNYQEEIKNLSPGMKEAMKNSFVKNNDERMTQQEDDGQLSFFVFFVFVAMILFSLLQIKKIWSHPAASYSNDEFEENDNLPSLHYLQYKGNDLHFSNDEINRICTKYNSYYKSLSGEKKDIFAARLQKFVRSKTFYVYAEKGYKEMPVLISAAAVQITFGMKEYLLPYFENIVIHPQEYLGTNPLRILEGNVQGNSITLSWKHFLEDYQNPADGKNVGLHEMAHALQVQYLFNSGNNISGFKKDFVHFDQIDDYILQTGKRFPSGLLDANALSNTNELWATSVELFFEKPVEFKLQYPDLYKSVALALNQETEGI